MLQIYNSFTKSKEIFEPIVSEHVSLYVCGMTVYDFCHIGHARILIFFDTVDRFLQYSGYQVKYVRNITDIDDKIIQRAHQNQENFMVLTDRFIRIMHEDTDSLKLLSPDLEPRATEFMPEIIQMVQVLLDKGYAYIGESGDVYYDVSRFEKYSQLSHRDLDDLQIGARIEPSEDKKNPLDFVLWKSAKPREPSWSSPWGKGRPGWHIECSAMATHCLANHIDIHGGGADLLFPHHENEIAQSEASTGEKFVNIWMHVGYLQVDQEKMSKSLGNIFTIREILDKFHPEVLKYFMLSTHYRKPINYTEDAMIQAKQALESLYIALRGVSLTKIEKGSEFETQFVEAMEDDFNTPKALSVLFDLAHHVNRSKDTSDNRAHQLATVLKHLGNTVSLLEEDPESFFKDVKETDQQVIESMIQARSIARSRKDFQTADRIRDELDQLSIVLEDKPDSTTIWRKKL